MSRRRRYDPAVECTCDHTVCTNLARFQGRERSCSDSQHHYGCPNWGVCDAPSGRGLRPHKVYLGSPRMSYKKWQATATPYTWPLWRNWKPPTPTVANGLKHETPAQVQARCVRAAEAEANVRRARIGTANWELIAPALQQELYDAAPKVEVTP